MLVLLSSPSPLPASLQCHGVGREASSSHRQSQLCPPSPLGAPQGRGHPLVVTASLPAQGTQAQGLGINPSSGRHKRADLGSHPAVLARALWQSDISLSLYHTPEVSQPDTHFLLCQTGWALLRPPNLLSLPSLGLVLPEGTPVSAPSPGPCFGRAVVSREAQLGFGEL